MELKPHFYSFDELEYNVRHLYGSLRRSSENIYNLVDNEINEKGIYKPKIGSIVFTEKQKEFESFQEILRNLNNFIYFNSLLLGSYSIFEVTIKDICIFVDEFSNPKFEFEEPKRSIIKNCRKFLKDSKLVDFSNNLIDAKYTNILKIGKVRNLIAHKNGNIIQDKTKLIEQQTNYKLFKSMKYLTILQNGQVYINDEELLKDFIKDSEIFISLIIKDLKHTR